MFAEICLVLIFIVSFENCLAVDCAQWTLRRQLLHLRGQSPTTSRESLELYLPNNLSRPSAKQYSVESSKWRVEETHTYLIFLLNNE